ncbi:MAG: HlyD family efflux transporter periplasmic adaptor subunit [Roseivirga sp.]
MTKQPDNGIDKTSLDIRSNAVTEILGQAPNWVIRWGISVVLVIVIVLLTGAALISYDDVIPARITITTLEPPVYIKARSSGKIVDIFVSADQKVSKNEPLAIIGNNANLEDVLWLRRMIREFTTKASDLDSISIKFPVTLSLGDLQMAYYTFVTNYQEYLLHLKNRPNRLQIDLLSDQIYDQQGLLKRQEVQLALFEEELQLAQKAHDRNKSLLNSGVISAASFEELSRAYLSDKQRYESLKIQTAGTRISISTLNGNRARLELTEQETLYNNGMYLKEAIQNLKNAIKNWEHSYMLQSPIDGQVTLFDIWNKYQNVDDGTVLFTIVPEAKQALIGHLVLPVQNSGKVRPGQKVIIKIDNYPHAEWGSLTGFVTSISSVPKQGLAEYAIQVRIETLNTSFGKTMAFKQEMQGTAEIVTEELTVMQRIFYQLREVFNRK